MSGLEREINPLYLYISTFEDSIFEIKPLAMVTTLKVQDGSFAKYVSSSPKTSHKVIMFKPSVIKNLNDNLTNCYFNPKTAHISIYQNRDFIAPRDSSDGMKHTTQLHITLDMQMYQQQFTARMYIDDQHSLVSLVCKPEHPSKSKKPLAPKLVTEIKTYIQNLIHNDQMREIFNGVSALIDASNEFMIRQQGEFAPIASAAIAEDIKKSLLDAAEAKFDQLLPSADFDALELQKHEILSIYKSNLLASDLDMERIFVLLEQKELLLGHKIVQSTSGDRKPTRHGPS